MVIKIINVIKVSSRKEEEKLNYKEISQYLKVIADSSRLEILDLLSCGELCACDLLEHFSFSQPTLSHHMKVLKTII